jgi:hypothetical protein
MTLLSEFISKICRLEVLLITRLKSFSLSLESVGVMLILRKHVAQEL